MRILATLDDSTLWRYLYTRTMTDGYLLRTDNERLTGKSADADIGNIRKTATSDSRMYRGCIKISFVPPFYPSALPPFACLATY